MNNSIDEPVPMSDADDVPLTYPDGSYIPVGLTLMLAWSEHITISEARRRMIEAWRGGQGNRESRRRNMKLNNKRKMDTLGGKS